MCSGIFTRYVAWLLVRSVFVCVVECLWRGVQVACVVASLLESVVACSLAFHAWCAVWRLACSVAEWLA